MFASISQFYTAFRVHLFLLKLAFEKQESRSELPKVSIRANQWPNLSYLCLK